MPEYPWRDPEAGMGREVKEELEARHDEGGPFVQAVEATSMAMIVTDCESPDNPIIFANDAFLALSGYEREEVLGRNYRFLYGSRTDPETAAKIEQALSATGDITLESLLYRKGGRGLWVMHHVSVQRDNDRVRRHFASFFDIDRRVRAEREARRAYGLLTHRVERRTRELSQAIAELQREIEKRKAAEEVLRHTLSDKEMLLQQRETLVREVNHRVTNTLQMAMAFLTVQASTSAPEIAAGLAAAIGRLERLADVHRLLYETVTLGLGAQLDGYLSELCHHLMAANEGAGHRIAVVVDVEEGWWSADQAIPIALIVNEALTNALKYAFPGSSTGTVEVSLRHVGNSFFELVIADDGVGGEIPQRPGSLGMKLIDTFARQLRGTLSIDHTGGTRITVRFPHQEEDRRWLAE